MNRTNTNSSSSSSQALESGFLAKNLVNSELIRRLKVVTETLEGYTDEDDVIEQAKRDIEHLADALGSDWLIQHKNKDVRLLVACALADVLRIYAPDPPYGEETSAAAIRLFLKILRGFESPDMTPQHPSYSIHFYLLERLNVISIFSIINELVNYRDELLKELAVAAYNIAGNMVSHSASHKVTEHLTAILCCVIEEMESYDLDLFDLVVGALCKNEKKENPAGWNMMKTVIASCENHFQPFVERHIHQVKAGFHLESELTNGERLSEAVYELSSIAPRVLTQILPAYAEDLVVEDSSVRIKAVKLLGAVFSVGNFSRDFGSVFAEFKRRSLDKDPEVRRTMVSVLGILLQRRPELSKALLEDNFLFQGDQRDAPMYSLVLDSDERIRKEAVETILELGLSCPEAVPLTFLRHVADRTLDRRPTVRQAAIEGLCKLYQKFCAPFEARLLSDSAVEKFGWIPSRIVTLIPSADVEMRVFITWCLEEVCLNDTTGSGRGSELISADLYRSLNEKSREQISVLFRSRAKFQEAFLKLSNMRETASKRDLLDESTDREESALIQRLSQSFADSSRAQDMFRKLIEVKVPKVWENLTDLIKKPRSNGDVQRVLDEVLKRLGPKNALIDFVKLLVQRISDNYFGLDFVKMILLAISKKEDEKSSAAVECLSSLPVLASLQPSLFVSQQRTLKLALLNSSDDQESCEHILRVLMLSANDLKDLKNDEEIMDRLEALCQSESFKVAKFAGNCIVNIAGPESQECKALVRSSIAALEYSPKLPGVFAALSEVAKGATKVFKAADQTTIVAFAKKVLHQSWSVPGKKDKKLILNARCNAIKVLSAFILGSVHQEIKKDEKKLQDLMHELGEILNKRGDVGSDTLSEADKGALRLTAGSCILKICKVKELRDLVSPRIFLSLSLLCEDDDVSVRKKVAAKIWKGTGLQQGRLPFHFAAMVVLGAHEPEPSHLEYVKTVLKNILALMKKLRSNSGKVVMSIAPERILPWLVYILANHPKFLDADEDDAQIAVAFKKYLDLLLNTITQSGTDEKIFPMLWQTLDHISQCSVTEAALAESETAVVQRNIGIICEVGKRLVTKFGGQKKWDSEVLRDHLSKVVDSAIFVRHQDGAKFYTPTLPDSVGILSPPRKGGSAQSTPASTAQKAQPQLKTRSDTVKSPASRKRLEVDKGDDEETSSTRPGAERTMPKRATKTAMRRLDEVSEDEEAEDTSAAESDRKALTSPPARGRRMIRNRDSQDNSREVDDEESSPKPSRLSTADKKKEDLKKKGKSDSLKTELAEETPKKRSTRGSSVQSPIIADLGSPASGRKTDKLKAPAATKTVRESPYRNSSPGTSQNSLSSPRVSTAHAEQVLAAASAQASRSANKRPRVDSVEEPLPKTKVNSVGESRKRKQSSPDSLKFATNSKSKDDFDFDEDLDESQGPPPKARESSLSSQTKAAKSSARASSSPASHKSEPKVAPKVLSAKLAAAASHSILAPTSSARVAKGRESASHEAPASAALERLELNSRKNARRGASPVSAQPPEAPQPKAKRRRL